MARGVYLCLLIVVIVSLQVVSSRCKQQNLNNKNNNKETTDIQDTSASSIVSSIEKMASIDNLTKEQVIPDVIDTKPNSSIEINYDSGAKVQQGEELTPTQVKNLPKFSYQSQPDQLYTLAMVDPDAPSRNEPKFREILHYLVANIPGSDVAKGDTLAEYIGSGAPQGTGLHRYIFLLFKQKNGRLESDIKIPKTSRAGRKNFSIREFAKKNNLGEPIAANFFQAKYDDYVPILHSQLS